MTTPLTDKQIEMVTYAYRRMGFVSNSDNGYMAEIFSKHAEGIDIDLCIQEEARDRRKYTDEV